MLTNEGFSKLNSSYSIPLLLAVSLATAGSSAYAQPFRAPTTRSSRP